MGMMDRDFGRSDMGMNRSFGESFGGLGKHPLLDTRVFSYLKQTCVCVCTHCVLFFSVRWRNGRIWRRRRNGEL